MDFTGEDEEINWEEKYTPSVDEEEDPGKPEDPGERNKVKGQMSRMLLNTNKAGMDGLDKEKINKIIMDASIGSRYYENEQKKDKQANQRIGKLLALKARVMPHELKTAQTKVDKLVKDLERSRDLTRTIVHIDMDMFYAAVEMLEKPELKEKPMAVGGKHMLSTSNYVARRYGVRAGMPGFIGQKLCPDLIIVPTNFGKYRDYSSQVKEILGQYDPNYSMMSLDEAYLDFTEHMIWRQTTSERERTFCGTITGQCGPPSIDTGPSSSTETCGEPISDPITSMELHNGNDSPSLCSPNCYACSRLQKNEIEKEANDDHGTSNCDVLVKNASNSGTISESHDTCEQLGKNTVSCSESPEEIQRDCNENLHLKSRNAEDRHQILFGRSIEEAVREMRYRIQQRTKLTASAGIAPNCMLAKVASDMNKPNGQYIVQSTRDEVNKFILDLPVRKISGIGKVMEKTLSALGVRTCTDLYQQRALLYKIFPPISFNHFIRISIGLGSTCVGREEGRKSLSTERTFGDKSNPATLMEICRGLSESLAQEAEKHGLKGRTLTLKTKTVGFEVKNRSQSLPSGFGSFKEIHGVARDLLKAEIRAALPKPLSLRLMGIRLSSFLSEDEIQDKQKQISLMSFVKKSSREQNSHITNAVTSDRINMNNKTQRSMDFVGHYGAPSASKSRYKSNDSQLEMAEGQSDGALVAPGEATSRLEVSSRTSAKQVVKSDATRTQPGIKDHFLRMTSSSLTKLGHAGVGNNLRESTGIDVKRPSTGGERGVVCLGRSLTHNISDDEIPCVSDPTTATNLANHCTYAEDTEVTGEMGRGIPSKSPLKGKITDQSGSWGSEVGCYTGKLPQINSNIRNSDKPSNHCVLKTDSFSCNASEQSILQGMSTGNTEDPRVREKMNSLESTCGIAPPLGKPVAHTTLNDPTSLSELTSTSEHDMPSSFFGSMTSYEGSLVDENHPERLEPVEHRYLCPVCNRETIYQNLDEFNHHVDLCLNQGAISSILKHEDNVPSTSVMSPSAALKRPFPSTTPGRKSRKKPKTITLDKFFPKSSSGSLGSS